jgi:pimeloyl-ACP methyl ester carboxylesterase
MPYTNNTRVRIHYRIEGEGPPLVLQHGFLQSIEDLVRVRLCRRLEARLPVGAGRRPRSRQK